MVFNDKCLVSYMIWKVDSMKLCMEQDIRQMASTADIARANSFNKIFDDKFEDLGLNLVDAAYNFSFQRFNGCGFVYIYFNGDKSELKLTIDLLFSIPMAIVGSCCYNIILSCTLFLVKKKRRKKHKK
uniref:Uncharacterized protein n=1 Tax=Cacopsylla melanoneura TaxID=428564 RepID=A0A8D8RUG5_9HEMI